MRLTVEQIGELSREVQRYFAARELTMQEACYVLASTLVVLMDKILRGESDETKRSEIEKLCDSFYECMTDDRSADKLQ